MIYLSFLTNLKRGDFARKAPCKMLKINTLQTLDNHQLKYIYSIFLWIFILNILMFINYSLMMFYYPQRLHYALCEVKRACTHTACCSHFYLMIGYSFSSTKILSWFVNHPNNSMLFLIFSSFSFENGFISFKSANLNFWKSGAVAIKSIFEFIMRIRI